MYQREIKMNSVDNPNFPVSLLPMEELILNIFTLDKSRLVSTQFDYNLALMATSI